MSDPPRPLPYRHQVLIEEVVRGVLQQIVDRRRAEQLASSTAVQPTSRSPTG